MLRENKILKLWLMLAIFTFCATGCQSKPDTVEANKLLEEMDTEIDYSSIDELKIEPGSKIAYVVKDSKLSYWRAVETGAQSAVDDLNEALGYTGDDMIQLLLESSDSDVDSQINIVDTLLLESPDALCVAAIDVDSLDAQIETALESQIPVIAVDSTIKNTELEAYCGTDNEAAAALLAGNLLEMIGGSGKVAMLAHNPLSQTSADREHAFTQTMMTDYPDAELIRVIYEGDSDDLRQEVLEFINANPDLNAFYGTNGEMTAIILEACRLAEREDVVIVGFDISAEILDAIGSGEISGVILQNTYGMGYASVVAAIRSIQGLKNDTFIATSYIWVDKSNMENEDIIKYYY